MSVESFYWSRNAIQGFGKTWFPLVLTQVPDKTQSLLGSVVQELKGGVLGLGVHYPSPNNLTRPNLFIGALDALKGKLDLPDPFIVTESVQGPAQTMQVSKKGSLKADVGSFPSVPASAGLDIDYSRMVSITVAFGENASLRYIPTDFLTRLHRHHKGDATKVDPNVAIRINDAYIVDQVIIANNVSVQFASEGEFSAEFSAKLEHVNAASAGVSFSKTSSRTVTAKVSDGKQYLVGFSVIDWDQLG